MSSRHRDYDYDRRDHYRDRRDGYRGRRDGRRDDRRDDRRRGYDDDRGDRRRGYYENDRRPPSGGGRRFEHEQRGAAGGATHLAHIHGTKHDKVNCQFYFKMGACRHGDKCDRKHNKPAFSQTVIVPHMYINPAADRASPITSFDEFYIDIYEEFSQYGEIDELVVCDNLCDHMLGNVYVKYYDEMDTAKAVKAVHGRYYAGRQLTAEVSPATDFVAARCYDFDVNRCERGGSCNYMHIKKVAHALESDLRRDQPYFGHRNRDRV